MPVLGNLFGTPRRVALGMGDDSVAALREVGELLAFLREPEPPKGIAEAWRSLPIFKKIMSMAPRTVRNAPCQATIFEGCDVDLSQFRFKPAGPETRDR